MDNDTIKDLDACDDTTLAQALAQASTRLANLMAAGGSEALILTQRLQVAKLADAWLRRQPPEEA